MFLYVTYFLVLVSGIFWLANNQMLYLSFRNYFKINNQNSGKLLIMELGHLNERTKKKLPQYKFYTKLLLDLLDYSRTKGAKIQNQISELKSTLSFDLKFEAQISNEKRSALFQFLIISFFTWLFVFFSKQVIVIKIPFYIYIIMLCGQVFGLIIFFVLALKLQKRTFRDYEILLREMLVLQSLLEANIPINFALTESKIFENKSLKEKKFCLLNEHLTNAINRLKLEGIPIKDDLKILIVELCNLMEEEFRLFHRKIELLKFSHLALIYLPIYFLYMVTIFKFFMEQ